MSDTAPPSVMSFDGMSDSDVAVSVSSSSSNGQASELPSRVSTPVLHNEPTKHPRFYYKDGSLSFWFEDTVFRIHGSIFASLSPFWAERLDSVDTLNVMKGEIDLSGSELSSFLSILYPKNFCEPESKTVQEWTAVLRVASIWKFETIRQLAIKQLDGHLPPLDRLVLSRSYDIANWLPGAFVDMILRETSLTMEEMQRLGSSLQDIAHITIGREAVLCRRVPANKHSVRTYVLKHIMKVPVPSESEVPPTPVTGITPAPAQNVVVPPTTETLMTPQTLPSMRPDDANTQFTFEESLALKTALSNYDYDAAIQYARPGTIPAFCEAIALIVDDLDWLGNYEKLTFSIVRLVVHDAPSHQRALRMLSFLSIIAEPKKGLHRKYKALLKAIVEELRETWKHADADGVATDESIKRLKSFEGHTKAFKVLGPRDFLLDFPRVYMQRSQNLKPFIAAVEAAKLFD